MSYTTGTATDYKNLLEKLRDYITGVDVSPNVDRGWSLLKDNSTTSPQPSEYEMIFQGHGDSSPAKEIFFGIKTYENVPLGYYNWDVKGFTGYLATSPETAFESQPGVSPDCYIPLQSSTITYWFYVTGRRVCMIAKTGTSYQFMYCGFIDPLATDSEYPYPMLVMGSSYLEAQKFNDNDLAYSSSSNPGGLIDTTPGASHSPGYLRFTDGQWYGVKNYRDIGSNEEQQTENLVNVWPLSDYTPGDFDTINSNPSSTNDFGARYRKGTAGGTPLAILGLTEDGGAGVPPMFPLTLVMRTPSTQIFGEIHNVYWVSGGQGLTAEDTITDTTVSPNQVYTTFQNIHRSDDWMFIAIKDE